MSAAKCCNPLSFHRQPLSLVVQLCGGTHRGAKFAAGSGKDQHCGGPVQGVEAAPHIPSAAGLSRSP